MTKKQIDDKEMELLKRALMDIRMFLEMSTPPIHRDSHYVEMCESIVKFVDFRNMAMQGLI